MCDKVKKIIDDIIRVEGAYSNNPADKGGETMYGITVSVARANGYSGPMANMPRAVAERIYRDRYVVAPRFDKVLELSEPIGVEMIDTGVNMGPSRAAEFLQRWLNGFNNGKSGYQDLFVDGRVGGLTLDALERFLAHRGMTGERVMLRALNAVQGARYLEIAERTRSQRTFLYGWMRTRVMI